MKTMLLVALIMLVGCADVTEDGTTHNHVVQVRKSYGQNFHYTIQPGEEVDERWTLISTQVFHVGDTVTVTRVK